MSAPIPYVWIDGCMVPVGRFARLAHEQFEPDHTYLLADVEERSDASHKHEFAWLREAWQNLPEALSDQYPTPDHLRRHALIMGGFYNETRIDCSTNAAALRVAALMRADNPFAVAIVRGSLVIRRTAKSQSRRGPDRMDKDEFQRSKTAVLEIVAEMIGVEPSKLEAAA